ALPHLDQRARPEQRALHCVSRVTDCLQRLAQAGVGRREVAAIAMNQGLAAERVAEAHRDGALGAALRGRPLEVDPFVQKGARPTGAAAPSASSSCSSAARYCRRARSRAEVAAALLPARSAYSTARA